MPYCWKCGAEIGETQKFCTKCGAPAGGRVSKRARKKEGEWWE